MEYEEDNEDKYQEKKTCKQKSIDLLKTNEDRHEQWSITRQRE